MNLLNILWMTRGWADNVMRVRGGTGQWPTVCRETVFGHNRANWAPDKFRINQQPEWGVADSSILTIYTLMNTQHSISSLSKAPAINFRGGGTFLNAYPKQCFHRFLKCESSNLCFQQGRSSNSAFKKISHVGHCHCQNWGPLLMRWAGDSKVGWCKDGLLCSAPAPRHGPLAAGPGRHMLVTLYNYIQY